MSKIFGKYTTNSGAILIFALMGANFLNFIFNAFLGRILTLEEYGALTLINTLWFLLGIFINSLSTTTNHFVSFHSGNIAENKGTLFYKSITKNSFRASLLVTTLWLAITPFLTSIFHLSTWFSIVSITPIITLGTMVAIGKGFLQGSFMFMTLAVLVVTESISKLIFAALFVLLGFSSIVYLSIPLSVLTAFVVTYLLSPTKEPARQKVQHNQVHFPLRFYMATVITSLSSAAFLSLDILLAKHYLEPKEAGVYALLSLVGKMIYFFGSLLNSLMVTYISRDMGASRDTKTTFYKLFTSASLLTFIAYGFFGHSGDVIVPLLFGKKALVILPYLPIYGIGIAIFTLSSIVVSFHLSTRRYIFSYFGLLSSALMCAGIFLAHRNIMEIVSVITIVSTFYFLIVMVLHLYYLHWKKVKTVMEEKLILPEYKKLLPIGVSVCVPAYNEAATIGKLLGTLSSQKTETIQINKIIVVSSASTDETEKIVENMSKNDPRILLLKERTRRGKASAINHSLRHIHDPFVVIHSADTIPEDQTIEKLCRPFLTNKTIGMTGGAPIPLNNRNSFVGFIVHTWWWFHRHIPRFGEIIAYRNILERISPTTAVDEAYIQAKFIQMGYQVVLVHDAVVYNKGADNLRDMVKQRRRIHNGHSRLANEESVRVTSLSKNTLWLLLFQYEIRSIREFIWLLGGIAIEFWAVFLALWDKYIIRKNPVVWDIATTTKRLNHRQQKRLQEALG